MFKKIFSQVQEISDFNFNRYTNSQQTIYDL